MLPDTLFVTDLDGTLLNSRACLSDFTRDTLNRLTAQGLRFTFATARSVHSALPLLPGLVRTLPAIYYNGSFIRAADGTLLSAHYFLPQQAEMIFDRLRSCGVAPIVYSMVQGRERCTFSRALSGPEMCAFIDTKAGDPRMFATAAFEGLSFQDVFYFTCIDSAEKLQPLYEAWKDMYTCYYQKDLYSGHTWLEVTPPRTGKSFAVQELAQRLQCQKIVCFGDGVNDVSMFRAADLGVAVGNACDALKAVAGDTAACNDDDGVVRWLLDHLRANG